MTKLQLLHVWIQVLLLGYFIMVYTLQLGAISNIMTAETFFLFRLFFLKFSVGCGIEVNPQVWGSSFLKFSPLFFLRHLQVHRLFFFFFFLVPRSQTPILASQLLSLTRFMLFPCPYYAPACHVNQVIAPFVPLCMTQVVRCPWE